AGAAYRCAGKAPLFQQVAAGKDWFDRYVTKLVAACTRGGVTFRYDIDVAREPDLLVPFDRIVIATGARYRFGLARVSTLLLDIGAGRWPLLRQIFSASAFRDWFYYRARTPTGAEFQHPARPEQAVLVIGDAVAAGK